MLNFVTIFEIFEDFFANVHSLMESFKDERFEMVVGCFGIFLAADFLLETVGKRRNEHS